MESHPELRWKPNVLHSERALDTFTKSPIYGTLVEALEEIKNRKKKELLLVTRLRNGWVIYKYENKKSLSVVTFRRLTISGLPLGGDPLSPNTYIVDSHGRVARIVHTDNGYSLSEGHLPTAEFSELWIDAVVPTELYNSGKLLVWTPKITLRPSLDDLAAVVGWVNTHVPPDTKVKAAGSRHSWSDVATTKGVYISPENLKFIRTIDEDPAVYRPETSARLRMLVRGGSGSTVREMNKFLWEHGKSFRSLGGYDGQTLGGVFNTSTHGSCFTSSHLAEVILSIDLVLANGTINRIEPTNGITDANLLRSQLPQTKLIQNDDYFYAALINMGAMGIVHSYVVDVTEKFHLKEIRTLSSTGELKQKLTMENIYNLAGVEGLPSQIAGTEPIVSTGTDGGFKGHPKPAYHLEFLFNPHGTKVIITSRHPLTLEEAEDQDFGFQPPGRDLVRTVLRGARFSRPAIPNWFQEQFNKLLTFGISTIIHLFPKKIPGLIDSSMDTLIDDAYVDRSFNVFNIGAGTNSIPALSCTIFVPVSNDLYLGALDIVQDVAKRFASRGLYETAPVSMRFVKASRAMLGVPKDTCAFEFIFTADTKHAQQMVDAYDEALRRVYGDEVRVHWGQMMREPAAQQIQGMYPKYGAWRAIRDELDPQGRFLNEWQSKTLAMVPKP